MAYGLLLTKIFKARHIDLSDEIAIAVDKNFSGTLSPLIYSLNHYRMIGSPYVQSSRSRTLSSSVYDLCMDINIKKKMENFHDVFKTNILGING